VSWIYSSGCEAAAIGAKLSRVNVVAAYPITPQTSIVEKLAGYIACGQLDAEMVHVDGEHSAMSVCVGASSVGARAFTATCGQGLAYMQEPVFWAAGLRLPIVMAVTNRSLLAPNTIFCDHQDSLSQRDSGWLQFYTESCQEVLDSILIAYRLAEDPRVLLPVMVCLDGFFLSHLYEPVDVPSPEDADAFLGVNKSDRPTLDPAHPKHLNVFVPPKYYTEFEYDKHLSIVEAAQVLTEIYEDFHGIFGRRYSCLEAYEIEGADMVLVAMGSMSGTIRAVVREQRARGVPLGMIKIRTFRPFLTDELRSRLRGASVVGVFDRDISFGSSGALHKEVLHALSSDRDKRIVNFIVGLGGRDVTFDTVHRALRLMEEGVRAQQDARRVYWIDLSKEMIGKWGLEQPSVANQH